MLKLDDIKGARPNKFSHSKKRHNYPQSQYSPKSEQSFLNGSFRTLVDHDIYLHKKLAEKITNSPPPNMRAINSFAGQADILDKSASYQQKGYNSGLGSPKNTTIRMNDSPYNGMNMHYVDTSPNAGHQQNSYMNKGPEYQSGLNGYPGSLNPRIQDSLDTFKSEVEEKNYRNSSLADPTSQLKKTLNGFYGVESPPSGNTGHKKGMSVGYVSPQQPQQRPVNDFSEALTRETPTKAMFNPADMSDNINDQNGFYSPKVYGGARQRVNPERRMDHSFGGHSHSQHYAEMFNPNNISANASFKLDPITHKKAYRPIMIESPLQQMNFRSQVSLPQYRAY